MKKKLLPLAMLAGLAGAVGTAQAAHLNPDGLGQVLIYPYYTTLEGQHTDIHLVNTTNETKAVKIRFLEGQNSREVRDFHLYLSAYDHFTGVITATGEGENRVARFITADTSCTVPAIPTAGVPFTNIAYTSDEGTDSLSRTLEGYIEVIEMGVLGTEAANGAITEAGSNTFGAAAAAKHVNGTPDDCAALVSAWSASGSNQGAWLQDPTANLVPGTGGLYGFASVFNVAEGTSAAYSATAIDNFNNLLVLHDNPGTVLPSLINVIPDTDIVDGNVLYSDSFGNDIDAVSALFTRDSLQNDYVTDPGLAAETDWVITFPTKRFYVNEADLADRQPFTAEFTENMACEHIELAYYDREEGSVTVQSGPVFSPAPDTGSESWELCSEVNVITFNGSNVLESSLRYNLPLEDGFVDGWATIDFTQAYPAGTANTSDFNDRIVVGDDYEYHGLPVVGFAVIKYTNGNLNGILSNYTGVVDHKYTRDIQ